MPSRGFEPGSVYFGKKSNEKDKIQTKALEYGLYTDGPFLKLAAPNSRKIQISRGFLAA